MPSSDDRDLTRDPGPVTATELTTVYPTPEPQTASALEHLPAPHSSFQEQPRHPSSQPASPNALSSRPERSEAEGSASPASNPTSSSEPERSTADPIPDPATPFTLEHPPTPPPVPRKLNPKPSPTEASQSPFSITVGHVYDGPLDLLLDLIRKQNIDIYDIPIARITAQFLEYTHHLQQNDVDQAGEFIYVASLLIHIKSKTLLPRDPSNPLSTSDPEDPRRELVERLLDHERFKAAAQMLLEKQQIEEATWTHPGMPAFLKDLHAAADNAISPPDLDQEIAADTVDLVRVFSGILARLRSRPVFLIDEDAVTVAQMIEYTQRRLVMEDHPLTLSRLLHNTHTERAVICMFLALLELVRLQAILLHQPIAEGDILIKKSDSFDQVFEDQRAARDDYR